MWLVRLIFAPFMAVSALLLVLAIFALGFFCVVAGLALLPKSLVLGWVLFAWGCGVWLCMIFRGINALFGGRNEG